MLAGAWDIGLTDMAMSTWATTTTSCRQLDTPTMQLCDDLVGAFNAATSTGDPQSSLCASA
jgi:hypothetical protein